jgi:hypothetical protein
VNEEAKPNIKEQPQQNAYSAQKSIRKEVIKEEEKLGPAL